MEIITLDLTKLKRDDVVPYYCELIEKDTEQSIIAHVNQRIITRWSVSALLYIKEQAWKALRNGSYVPPTAKKHICESLIEYVSRLGIKRINELPGLFEHKVDEQWTIKCNGHKEPIDNVPPFHWYIEYNGWPAGILSLTGEGEICDGDTANIDTLQAALESYLLASNPPKPAN